MASKARIYARLQTHADIERINGSFPDHSLDFRVEWKVIVTIGGKRPSGTAVMKIADVGNDLQLRQDLREALCAKLNAELSPDQPFQPKDIVGYSI